VDHGVVVTTRLSGVFVAADVVGSSGFTARVGHEVTLALSAYCLYRRAAADKAADEAAGDKADDKARHDTAAHQRGWLDGTVVPPTRDSMFGGWVLDAGGILFHVTESSSVPDQGSLAPGDYDREAGSDPEEPAPAPHTRVRMRAGLSVADDYVPDEVRDGWGVDLMRPWLVERIVDEGGRVVTEIRRTHEPISYLIDLAWEASAGA
jgi:hypothetical protein